MERRATRVGYSNCEDYCFSSKCQSYLVEAKVRSSHRRCSIRKGVLRNFAKFTGKHMCQSLFLNKVAGLRPTASLLKERLWRRCFPVNFTKFLRTPFLQNTFGPLLLQSVTFTESFWMMMSTYTLRQSI